VKNSAIERSSNVSPSSKRAEQEKNGAEYRCSESQCRVFQHSRAPKREQKSTTKEKDVSEEERKNHETSRPTEPYRH
jgi:hypothetical protein